VGGQHALLTTDEFDHRRAWQARPVPGAAQSALGELDPLLRVSRRSLGRCLITPRGR
jgi:hypothetical protein